MIKLLGESREVKPGIFIRQALLPAYLSGRAHRLLDSVSSASLHDARHRTSETWGLQGLCSKVCVGHVMLL